MHHASPEGGVPLSISGEMEFVGSDGLRVSATFFCSFEVGAAQVHPMHLQCRVDDYT